MYMTGKLTKMQFACFHPITMYIILINQITLYSANHNIHHINKLYNYLVQPPKDGALR